MEILIIAFIIASFIGQVLIFRYFFKQMVRKITVSTTEIPKNEKVSQENTVITAKTTIPQPSNGLFVDKPAKNQVSEEDTNEVDYNENVFVPKDVKVEIEGGDTQVPPGYDEKEPVTV